LQTQRDQVASANIYPNVSLTLFYWKPVTVNARTVWREYTMAKTDQQETAGSSKLMHYGMMVCCAVMLLPVAAFLLAGGTIAGMWNNLGLFAPIALCIGAHVLMFKMMGKSCHSSKKEQDHEPVADASFEDAHASVPEVARQS
jgi:hypothetical protein